MKDLILVESPTKARTLTSFLKDAYDIQASMGHIRDLPKSKLGIDIEDHFKPAYVIPTDKRKTLEMLREKVKGASTVILATDPDREGEAIAFHLYEMLKKEAKKNTEFKRIVFHEITKEAIDDALTHPRSIDNNLVGAQTARRVLDRIVGYKISPLLWKKIKRNLSAGRVQSIALRLIVEREREIEKFQTASYCRVFVLLKKAGSETVEFELTEIDSKKVEQSTKMKLYDGDYTFTKTILDRKAAEKIASCLSTRTFEVLDVARKQTQRSPYPPFITSTLQQEASRRLYFPSKKTMSLAQRLYEEGFITYHRTDSFNLSQQFLNKSRAFIEQEFGSKYLSTAPRLFKTKSKVAQEAHEAIRPTKVEKLQASKTQIGQMLGPDAAKVYELIYKRAVATQMADAVFENLKVTVKSPNGEEYIFEKNGSRLLFDGFLKLWFYEENEELLPAYTVGEKLAYSEGKITDHTTAPPPRYNEASLIGTLEKNGIGRPSTYATIVSTIQERLYVEKQDNRFKPSAIGISVNDFLVKNFSSIDDIPFTAQMEDELDTIANGEKGWEGVISAFYKPFEKDLKDAEGAEKIELPVEKTDLKCPLCGNDVIVRMGKFGKFYACSTFPDCKYTAPIVTETNYICPQDGGKVVERKTRKGRIFYGCENYPQCKFAVWKLTDIKKKEEPQKQEEGTIETNNK